MLYNSVSIIENHWASLLKHLLSRLGFLEVWNAQGVGNISKFLGMLKTRVKDIFIQDWHARLEDSSRARCYINIAKFEFQQYLKILKIQKYRKSLCKLRVSSHRLEIESGRWTKPNKTPLNERLCMICSVLEDEFHFTLECPLYKDIRKKYIKRYYWLIELFLSENCQIIKNLSMFINKAFEMRKDFGIV